ncbi:MAG: aminotransferase class V-fold PLP-dependent enzyme [Acidobacteria bacterium]|nr:aminotransferase class V-fold PLP-dependent enzyme [Acidobacteriota bacterium]
MGTVTTVGGSLMPPEVKRAMEQASQYFVDVPELQRKAGARIAQIAGVPAAMVTAGAASAITVATAACITRGDRRRYAALPDTRDMPNEIVQQRSHRSGYEAQMLLVGAKIVWVETREEAERAIGPRTAMLFFLNKNDEIGRIRRQEWIEIGKSRNIPLFNDAAADVPPAGRLSGCVKEGFDLVAFSGGKGLCGPQCAGLLLGRQDLIEAARPAISPVGGIGRGMKVGKEEIIGMLAAVERYMKIDHDAEIRMLEGRVREMIRVISAAQGVAAEVTVPKIANQVPHLAVRWDETEKNLTSQQVAQRLREGEPPIAVLGQGRGRLMVSVWMMRGNEHRIVARRLREIFTRA